MIQWAVSISLLLLGLMLIIGDWVMAVAHRKRGEGYSFVPFFGGLFLLAGVLLIPVAFPIPRWLAGVLAMCLDVTISVMLPMLLWQLIRGFPEQPEPDHDEETDPLP